MKQLIKNLYKLLPFKKQLFSITKKFWKPSERIYKHLYFKGIFSVPVKKNVSFKMQHYGYQLENDIFWAGINENWEKYSLGIWQKLSEKADVVFDIGANTGVYSLIAKTIKPKLAVHAFEPISSIYQKLKNNIDINQYTIQSHELAASDKTGTAIIYGLDTEHQYAASITNTNNFTKGTEIRTITLDEFVQKNSITKVDLIKIDVEGHEPEVLSGFSKGLFTFRPTMLIEVLSEDVGNRVNNLLQGMGYLFYNIDEERGPSQVEKITKSSGYNFLICQPETANYLKLKAN